MQATRIAIFPMIDKRQVWESFIMSYCVFAYSPQCTALLVLALFWGFAQALPSLTTSRTPQIITMSLILFYCFPNHDSKWISSIYRVWDSLWKSCLLTRYRICKAMFVPFLALFFVVNKIATWTISSPKFLSKYLLFINIYKNMSVDFGIQLAFLPWTVGSVLITSLYYTDTRNNQLSVKTSSV